MPKKRQQSRGTIRVKDIDFSDPNQQLMPGYLPATDWKPPVISSLPSWKHFTRIGLDTETFDEHLKKLGCGARRGAKLLGISLAYEDGPAPIYLPIGHSENNLDADHVLQYVKDNAATYEGDICGANLQYDLDILGVRGIRFPSVKRFRDVQLADPIINELHQSYRLGAIAERHGFGGKVEDTLDEIAKVFHVDPKGGMARFPGRFVAPYAAADADLPLKILRKQERIIEQDDLGQVYDLEMRLLPALLSMRQRGVAIDVEKLKEFEAYCIAMQQRAVAVIRQLTGWDLSLRDLNNAEALSRPLSQVAGFIQPRTAKGKPQIDKLTLAGIDHPIAKAVATGRKYWKCQTSFVASIWNHMVNGRIHPTFNQMRRSDDGTDDDDSGARFGRMSCVDPNLQQQPGRDEDYDGKIKAGTLADEDIHIGKYWRSIYIPDDGMEWAAADYGQQEPRWMVHYGYLAGAKGAAEMVRQYHENPNLEAYETIAKLASVDRGSSKTITLGVGYGMGGAKLCHRLKLPTRWIFSRRQQRDIEIAGEEGQAVLDKFDESVPFIRVTAKMAEKQAQKVGFVKTTLGRRCRFESDGVGGFLFTHKAFNRVIQGSAADQTKKAVVECYEQGVCPQLQVHDELDTSTDKGSHREANQMAEIMQTCVPMVVPIKVDVEYGASWGDSMCKGQSVNWTSKWKNT